MRRLWRWLPLLLLAAAMLRCGGGGGSGFSAVIAFSYGNGLVLLRVGEPLPPLAPTVSGTTLSQFSVIPPLPAGLSLDPSSGEVSGTPTAELAVSSFTFSAMHGGSTVATPVSIAIGPALPAAFSSLEPGFAAEIVQGALSVPCKIALSADGRIFFNELATGNVRVIDAAGNLIAQPFATLPVLTGGHRGLLGLALDPGFLTNGFLYVMACTPAGGAKPDRIQIVRFTASGNVGTNPTVLVDDLPIGQINNGGELLFDSKGNLFATLGDVEDPANSQSDSSLAGKVLRYTTTGGIPADNPDPSKPEWCRGLRNTFGLALHSQTGDLFGADNGPASDDELNFLQPGKNFEWGMSGPGSGFGIGFKITGWVDVITPTAMVFHDGVGFGPEYRDLLFLASYSDEAIRTVFLTGASYTDYEEQKIFAKFAVSGTDNVPLDLLEASDGSLLVSTFTAIYRIRKFY